MTTTQLRTGLQHLPLVLGWILCLIFLANLTPDSLFEVPSSVILEASDGSLLAAQTASDGMWRFPLEGKYSPKLIQAILTFEDEGFYQHHGFSLKALVRAFWQNITKGQIVSGGSTLTMQVVRLSRQNPPRTVWEKLWEIPRAISLEWHFTKDQILDFYLHHAPMGGNVVGLEAASWRYFGRSPQDLSWAQAALLAVLPNSPALIRLDRQRPQLLSKRNRLLDKLHTKGHLSADDLELAKLEPLPELPYRLPQYARHLLASPTISGRIRTTIDYDLQLRAESVVQQHLKWLLADDVKNIAALILNTQTNAVLAYVGNGPDSDDPALARRVDILTSVRSTGSLLKPFLYALCVDQGVIAPKQLLPDYPVRWGSFAPENYNKSYEGAIPADLALARSRNIPAVWLLRDYGLARFVHQLKEWGLSTLFREPDEYGLPFIIGSSEARPIELARLYTALGRTALAPNTDQLPPLNGLSRGAAWLTLEALAQSVRPGEDRAWQQFGSGRKIAWKTGTSQGWRDAWSVGVTPKYTVLVWVGNASGYGRPTLQGFSAAAPLMFQLFRLLPPTTWFPEPVHDLEPRLVSASSGHLASAFSPRTRYDLFPKNAPPSPVDPWSRLIHLDPQGRLADSRVVPPHELTPVKWFVLPPAMEYYYQLVAPSYQKLPPAHPQLPRETSNRLSILYPIENARIFIPIELSGLPGKLLVQAVYSGQGELFWHLDGDYLGSTTSIHQIEIRPDQGRHRLTLFSSEGDMFERSFVILSRQ